MFGQGQELLISYMILLLGCFLQNGDNQKPTVHAEELQLQQRQEQVMQV